MSIRQAKGKKHCKNIKRRAMRLWRHSQYQKGLWDDCLKACIEHHRRKVETEILESILKQRQEQLAFCDRHEWAEGCC